MRADPRPPPYPVDMLSGFFAKRSPPPIEMAANETPPPLHKSHELDTGVFTEKC